MSEKITFQELIESIAEETDNSKQFTQDFIKDFVEVINDGLEEDGSVNIAGFGKFNLRRVDEREGYNPQTEEKITIPAHNKLIFKPYKNLRELVNAPYVHQEAELIKEDEGEGDGKKVEDPIEEGSTDPKESGDQSDFIPTGPPTSTESTEEAKGLEDAENEEDIPFVFDDVEDKKENEDDSVSSEDPFPFDSDSEETSEEEDDEDIVEFNAEHNTDKDHEDEIDKELDEFFGDSDQPKEDDAGVEETLNQTEKLINESDEFLESAEDEDIEESEKEKAPAASPSVNQQRSAKSKNSVNPVIMIVAACILLLAGGGAWYYSWVSDNNQQQMQSQEMITAASDNTDENNQQEQSADNQNNQQSQQAADSDQNQPQDPSSSSSSTAATTAGTQDKDNEEIEIEKGQTLWSLAEEKYGNPRLWPWIYGTNESVENPDLIYAGNSLSVPLPSGPNNHLNDADSVGVAKGYLATYRWYKDNDSSKAKNHLLGAKLYHDDIRNIADVKIDKADLSYANQVR